MYNILTIVVANMGASFLRYIAGAQINVVDISEEIDLAELSEQLGLPGDAGFLCLCH
jgi:hypothetical protein